VEGGEPAERDAASFHPASLVTDEPTKLVHQARLPDSGLPNDEHHLALPGSRFLEAVPEGGQLTLTRDEDRQTPFGLDVEPAPRLAGRHDLPRRRRLRLALQAELPERAHVKETSGQTVSRLGDHNRARLRHLLEARGDVRRVADGRVIHPKVVPDAADDDQPSVEPLTYLEVYAAPAQGVLPITCERPLDAECGENRAPCVVLMGDRRAEQRHDPVAEELIDRPLVAMDLGQH